MVNRDRLPRAVGALGGGCSLTRSDLCVSAAASFALDGHEAETTEGRRAEVKKRKKQDVRDRRAQAKDGGPTTLPRVVPAMIRGIRPVESIRMAVGGGMRRRRPPGRL